MSQIVTNYEVMAYSDQILISDVLARLLQCNEVIVQKDARGRPFILNEEHDVSWSHSGGLLAVAWSPSRRVGIDIEKIRARNRWLRIAERFFAASEVRDLRDQNSLLAFLQLWCLKEAVIKAHGHGISYGLEKMVFRWSNGWQLARVPKGMGEGWEAMLIDVPDGYVGAVAWRDR